MLCKKLKSSRKLKLVCSCLSYEGEDGCAGGDGKTEFGFKWTNGACSRDSKAVENGFVCTKYAVANFCSDDSSKNYWECLP